MSGLYGRRYIGYFADVPTWFATATLYNGNGTPVVSSSINGFTSSADGYSWEWFGYFYARESGNYRFRTDSDDASYLWIGSNALSGYTTANANVNNGGLHGSRVITSSYIALTIGTYYPLRIQFGENGGGDFVTVSFEVPSNPGVFTTDGTDYYSSSDSQMDFNNSQLDNIGNTTCKAMHGFMAVDATLRPNLSSVLMGETGAYPGITVNRGDGVGGVAKRWEVNIPSDEALRITDNGISDYAIAFDDTVGGIRLINNPKAFMYLDGGSAHTINSTTPADVNVSRTSVAGTNDLANNRFTATVAGYYLCTFSAFTDLTDNTTESAVSFYTNGSYTGYRAWYTFSAGGTLYRPSQQIQMIELLAVNDYVDVRNVTSSCILHGNDNVFFTTHLIA